MRWAFLGHVQLPVLCQPQAGEVVAVLLRNPWGYDERMAVEEFLQEWHCLKLGRLIGWISEL